jgi:hypothetical protein
MRYVFQLFGAELRENVNKNGGLRVANLRWSTLSLLAQVLPNLFYSTSLALAASAFRLSSRNTAFRDSLILFPSRPMHFTKIC